jgi:hypothetical protein
MKGVFFFFVKSIQISRLINNRSEEGYLREERFSGNQRRIVNQHKTGVVSRLSLRDILKRRSEHLLTEEFDVQ